MIEPKPEAGQTRLQGSLPHTRAGLEHVLGYAASVIVLAGGSAAIAWLQYVGVGSGIMTGIQFLMGVVVLGKVLGDIMIWGLCLHLPAVAWSLARGLLRCWSVGGVLLPSSLLWLLAVRIPVPLG